MIRSSYMHCVTFLLITSLYLGIVQSGPAVWRLSASDGSKEDKELLNSISVLAFKHLLAYAHESVQTLAHVYNTTQTIQQKISMLKESIAEYQEKLEDKKYEVCNRNSNQETCYQCTKRLCYSSLAENCDPDDLVPPSMHQLSSLSINLPSSPTKNLKYFDFVPEPLIEADVSSLYNTGAEKTKNLELEVEDKKKPIGHFSDLFASLKGDVSSFESKILEEFSHSILEPIAGFSEDAFDAGIDHADVAFDKTTDGAEAAFKKLSDWGKSFNMEYEYDYDFFPFWSNLHNMDYSLFVFPSFEDDWFDQWDYEADQLWDDFEETIFESEEDMMEASDSFVGFGAEASYSIAEMSASAGNTVVDFGSEAGSSVADFSSDAENAVEKSAEKAKKAFKKVWKRWKRSVPDFTSPVKSNTMKDVCKKYLREGEWKFCQSFESDKQCQPRCKAEKNKGSYCSQLKDHALKLNDFIKELEAAVEIEQQLARSALQNHAWVSVLLKTIGFKRADLDERKISVHWIEIKPDSYDPERVWLFNDVKVGYSLKQFGDSYKMGNVESRIQGASNILNVYNLNATKPFAQAIKRDMNQTFFADEF